MLKFFCSTLITLISLFLIIPSYAYKGMVVSEERLASEAGAKMLREGGNAIDAAVATAYTLAVVSPCCGNIGGGGFMNIYFANGKRVFLNFREKAPAKATRNMFLDKKGNVVSGLSQYGYLAVGVPGTVLGLETARQKYGKLSREQVMAPAIALAEKGYKLTPYAKHLLDSYGKHLHKDPTARRTYMKNGKFLSPGSLIVQPDLAATLKLIAKEGSDAFYKGPIAKAIVAASDANGGILQLSDFANYTVQELQPLYCQYKGYDIYSSPPPSSGGVTLCEMLSILENFDLQTLGFRTVSSSRTLIETMRYAFLDRNSKLGDPDFVKNPIQQLLSKSYAKKISKKIKLGQTPPIDTPQQIEHMQTTHFSVMDQEGNAVAMTYTLDYAYGAGVIADHTGFFLNDQMDDFASGALSPNYFGLVQGAANEIAPGKRPLSSMTPTIVLKDGKVFIVTGSPGGPRIITAVLLTLLNVFDYHMGINDAVNTPRFHYQAMPDVVDTEPFAFPITTQAELQLLGYHLLRMAPWSAVESILVKRDGSVEGGLDYRRPNGAAIGVN